MVSTSKRAAVKAITMMKAAVVVVMILAMSSSSSSRGGGSSNSRSLFPSSAVVVVSAFEFQHDDDPEVCQRRAQQQQCTKDSRTWYECPISCSKKFEREGSMAEERDDPEQFFNLHVVSSKGSVHSLENNEGYITLFAVVPMMRGVSQYYYDVIEHIRMVYKYTVVSIVYPYQNPKSATISLIRPANDAKTITLMSGPPPSSDDDDGNTVTLNYLLSRTIVAGNDRDVELATDRPTIFLISHDGMFIERLVAPTMETIERRIKVYEQAMDFDVEDGMKKDL